MKRVIALTMALLPLAGAASAKDLVGVFQDALQSDPVIRQADANRLAAREARPQALSALLPQLNGTAGVTRDHQSGFQDQVDAVTNPANPNGPPLLEVVPESDVIDTTTKTWGLNLKQNVFSWSNWMALKAASAQVAQAEATYQAAEQQLILRVGTAYFNVLTAVDTLEADQAALEALARQQDQSEKRFDVGLIAITDVEDARAARDTAAATVIADKRALATAEDQLQEITGQKYDRLAKPGDDMPLLNPDPADESRWVDISLEQNPTLISSRLGADIARDNVRIAIGGHLPSLDILAGRSYTYNTSDETLEGFAFNGVDNKINDRQITLQLTVPLFSGGLTQSKVRQGGRGAELAGHRAAGTRCLSRRHQRHCARARLAPGARIQPHGTQGHRGGLRRRHAHFGGRRHGPAQLRAGADQLHGGALRLHRERPDAAARRRHPRPAGAQLDQHLADRDRAHLAGGADA
jgi:outer membrane protein